MPVSEVREKKCSIYSALKSQIATIFDPCECCGRNSRTISGFVYQGEAASAAYFVHCTLAGVKRFGANFDLILGKWGDGTSAQDRCAVSLEYRLLDNGPALMIISAKTRPVGNSELASRALTREEVVGNPISKEVFAIADTILAQDSRISELGAK
jgi:hypothetical protein